MFLHGLNAKLPKDLTSLKASKHFKNGKFHNSKQHIRKGNAAFWGYLKRLVFEKNINGKPKTSIPVKKINKVDLFLLDDHSIHFFKLGHSTILLKLGADFWLIDPVFSNRASPFTFFGPRRFHQSPIDIAQLPSIKGVVISHNHYDHLDKASIQALLNKTELFFAPLGVEGDLMRWGARQSQISTFDWWQEQVIGNVKLVFSPAHHYSGRWFKDNSTTLWGSWIVEFKGQRLFYSGDSGYFEGFREIGKRYGPFDICLVETGAYDSQWPNVHMQPEQSLQSFIDLRGKILVPIHNATFNLAFHPWNEPLIRIHQLCTQSNIKLLTPIFGQAVTVASEPKSNDQWWL